MFRFIFCLLLLTAINAHITNAQICSGSLGAPVVNETFGAGTGFAIGSPLPAGLTSLQYIADACGGDDGTYSLLQEMGSSCKGATWQSIGHDHTGDPYGYMMIINATLDPSLFFTQKVSGNKLCPNTTYQFSAWIMNILRNLPGTQGYSEPNITFSIETVDGKVLKTYNTGDIPATVQPEWNQYGTFFTSPSDGADIVVKMINNGKGGNGNDLALDDITFTPCGPIIQNGFTTVGNTADQSCCADDNLNYTLVAQQTGYTDPLYQWQINKNDGDGWINIANQTTTTLKVTINNAPAGKYQYRIGVLNKSNIGSESCRIYSDPLNVNVYNYPDIVLASNTSGCENFPLQISSAGGDTYQWTGPNNFTSNLSDPIITDHANSNYDGVYTVNISSNGCPSFASTTVKVYPAATINEAIPPATICAGDFTQLDVKTTNATHFKWTPAEGLDHDDIPNPIASPSVTTTYSVSVTNDGCSSIVPVSSTTITILKRPVANAGAAIILFEGQQATLNGSAIGDNVSYNWTPTNYLDDPTSLTPVTSSPDDITYTLHVISNDGCGQSSSSVFVRVYKKLSLVNTFSPNGDGINDYLNIINIGTYPNVLVSIFNRLGQNVFQSKGYGKPWDGNFNGAKLPVGTYYYIIDVKEDNIPPKSGWIFLVR